MGCGCGIEFIMVCCVCCRFLSKGMLSNEDDSKKEDGLIDDQSRLLEQKRCVCVCMCTVTLDNAQR